MMRAGIAVAAIALLLCGCTKTKHGKVFKDCAMGTTYMVHYFGEAHLASIQIDVLLLLTSIDEEISNWNEESWISKFNENTSTETVAMPSHVSELLNLSADLHAVSNGKLDPTISPAIELWGFGVGDKRKEPPNEDEITTTLSYCGFNKIEFNAEHAQLRKLHPKVQLNFSAIAKGYVVDQIAKLLEEEGVASYLIEFGGEIRVGAPKPNGDLWSVALNEAHTGASQTSAEQVLQISHCALATSGHYRRNFTHNEMLYSHLIDRKSGRPVPSKITGVTIQASTCAKADGLATASLLMNPEEAKSMLSRDSEVTASFFSEE